MIKVLIGKKGTGKTKTLIENVNNAINIANGDIVFISNDIKRHMYDISHRVRMVDTSEFEIENYDEFYGFVCGIISNNFDISNIYIDSIYKIVGHKEDDMAKFFTLIERLAAKFNVSFYFTISISPGEAPDYIKKYV